MLQPRGHHREWSAVVWCNVSERQDESSYFGRGLLLQGMKGPQGLVSISCLPLAHIVSLHSGLGRGINSPYRCAFV